jgi:hypothetical protein
MGFSSAKRALLTALEAGKIRHEARDVLSEKNLLAVGDVSVGEVIAMVRRARGPDYSVSPHHWDAETEVTCLSAHGGRDPLVREGLFPRRAGRDRGLRQHPSIGAS